MVQRIVALAIAAIVTFVLVATSPSLSGATNYKHNYHKGKYGYAKCKKLSMDHQYCKPKPPKYKKKKYICHATGSGRYVLIKVPKNSAHFTKHENDKKPKWVNGKPKCKFNKGYNRG